MSSPEQDFINKDTFETRERDLEQMAITYALAQKGFAMQMSQTHFDNGVTEEHAIFLCPVEKGLVQKIDFNLSRLEKGEQIEVTATLQDKKGMPVQPSKVFRGKDLTASTMNALSYLGSPVTEADRGLFAKIGTFIRRAAEPLAKALGSIVGSRVERAKQAVSFAVQKFEESQESLLKSKGWKPTDREDLKSQPGVKAYVRVLRNGDTQSLTLQRQDPLPESGERYKGVLTTHYNQGAGVLTASVSGSNLMSVSSKAVVQSERDRREVGATHKAVKELRTKLATEVRNPSNVALIVSPVPGTDRLVVEIYERGTAGRPDKAHFQAEVGKGRELDFVASLVKGQLSLNSLPVIDVAKVKAAHEKAQAEALAKAQKSQERGAGKQSGMAIA